MTSLSLKASTAQFHLAEAAFFKGISFQHQQLSTLSCYLTGVNAGALNPVIQKAPCLEFANALATCESLLQEHALPWYLILMEEAYTPEIASLLSERKFEAIDQSTAMVWFPHHLTPVQLTHPIHIQEMTEHLATWSEPLVAFENTPEEIEQYCLAHKRHPHLYHYTAFIASQPVSSLTLSIHNKTARIDDVATLPHYQHHGFASALVQHALHQSTLLGADCCFLEASSDGLSIYQKQGFQPLFHNILFNPNSTEE